MSRQEQHHARAVQPRPGPPVLAPGDVRADWCPACKAWTRAVGAVLLLTPDGVATVGTWAWCEICDDPTDQQHDGRPARGR